VVLLWLKCADGMGVNTLKGGRRLKKMYDERILSKSLGVYLINTEDTEKARLSM